jgi:RimJ/RimL family protein N-acetyltransferase
MKILETTRLTIRHFLPEDLDALYMLYCDLEAKKFIPDAPRTFQETQEELEWFLNGHPEHPDLGLWAAVDKQTHQLAGRVGLLPWVIDDRKEVEVAYLIANKYRRQGLATEAALALLHYGFEQLQLSRLICLIDQENLASIKVAEKIGMRFEKHGQDAIGPFLLYSRNKSL